MENHPVSDTPHRRDLEALAAKARALLDNTVSAATKRGYASDFFGDWKPWAESHNAPVLPAEPEWICLYLVDRSSALKCATLAGMRAAGIAGHSLSSRGITTAALNGIAEYLIRRQWLHAPQSRSFHRYIRVAERFSRSASSGLGL